VRVLHREERGVGRSIAIECVQNARVCVFFNVCFLIVCLPSQNDAMQSQAPGQGVTQ
jgi:hypothetical protein